MNHISISDFERFYRGTLQPNEMLVCDSHLSGCEECRTQLAIVVNMDREVASLMDSFREYGTTHLTYDETLLLAQGKVISIEAQQHMQACPSCAAEISDLRDFVHVLETAPRLPVLAPTSRKRPYWLGTIAAALLLACVGTMVWRHHIGLQAVTIVSPQPYSHQSASTSAAALPPEYDALLVATRSQERLPLPIITAHQAGEEILLGSQSSIPAFLLLTPLDEITESAKPEFRWEAVNGAVSYTIAVFDSHYRRAAEAKDVHGPSWRPLTPLKAGESYSWSVTAHCPRGDVRSPVPPQPEARFKVMSAAAAKQLDDAKTRFPQNHLLLAALAAQQGDRTYAALELEAIPAMDPDAPLAAKLLANLQARSFRKAK